MPTDPKRPPKRDPAQSAMEATSAYYEITERRFDRLDSTLNEVALNLGQVAAQLKEVSRQQERTAQAIENMRETLNQHLQLAQSQTRNIESLATLVASQGRTIEVIINRAV